MRPAMLFENFQMFNIYVAKCLEKRCCEINEPKLNNTQCGFHPGHSTTDQISLSSKFLRNLGSMPKTFTHVFSTSRKHTNGFLVKSFGECCGSTVLTTAFYWPSSHCIPAQKFVSASRKLNNDRSPLVLDSDKDACCHCFSLHSLHQRWPNYGPPTSLIRLAKYLANFFKCHVSDCRQQCNSINCCLSRKLYYIRPSSGQAVVNSSLGSKRLATPAGA